ncbi:hypothetical protein [Marinigracilibium pacificum]|uniref:Uncharacterized protein n=1 Tax=Marinigracilibium pacificum TaxID=2729599 RepID=A0A848IWP8_9BACT|nr:hypothetical protein [Marinigracilibium pacificum]NMM47705.1 hypothetical protein [Marinigracilibium pacificum]
MKSLIDKLKAKYPDLVPRMKITKEGTDLKVEIDFANPKYKLWFTDENSESYVVGIDFLHSHFDSGDSEFNQEAALEYIEDIMNDEVVAIGIKDKEKDFLIATMGREEGIKQYGTENEKIEVVSFTKEN